MGYTIALILNEDSQNKINNIKKFLNVNDIKTDYIINHISIAVMKQNK